MTKTTSEKYAIKFIIGGFVFIILAFILFTWNDIKINFGFKIDSEKFAQFGDFIGGIVGSIWALAGVILFYVALKEQRNDFKTNRKVLNAQTDALNQQIKEFELQREELTETRKVLNLQYETLNFQRFEGTFFKLIDLHHQFVDDLNSKEPSTFEVKPSYTKNENGCIKGYPAEFITIVGSGKEFLREIHRNYQILTKDSKGYNYKDYFNIIQNYGYNGLELYYRNLHGIFTFIESSQIMLDKNDDKVTKDKYYKILFNQLTTFEIIMLKNFSGDELDFNRFFKEENINRKDSKK
ncbi:putative phage abortive infection protein [uncultured Maribacter sp.]|uniref:putative phage abortive infection protein n=1 Tax=uncultured Maribacter sp. TaxID=431308 RepID=UPI00261ABC18|nr:putative phage abortive infection protein [uncultured Maribacter sp.]